MKTQFDIPALSLAYEGSANYKIVDGESDSPDRCFVFFSSNGIYFPNTEAEFHRSIIQNDRYEWEKLAPPKTEFRKAIFVRDVRKTWYVDGISEDRKTIDSVCELLREETKGFAEVVCIGNSAGGYAATLFGIHLNAEKIFNISGFFEIASQVNEPTNLALQSAQFDPEKAKWFDLSLLLKKSECAIYFLFPENCELDKAQARIVENIHCVRTFAFDEDSHGACAQNFVYPFLFVKTKIELDRLFNRKKYKCWGRFEFSVAIIGIRNTIFFFIAYIKKKILRLLNRWLTAR
jgi:hypothetical protein